MRPSVLPNLLWFVYPELTTCDGMDADPANEVLLGQLKERLSTLRGIDADSPYDELILGYVYRSSGEPEPVHHPLRISTRTFTA